MKPLLKGQTLLILAATLALGLVFAYFMLLRRPADFKDLPGVYQCSDFGLPDKNFSKLRITPEMKLEGISHNEEFQVGRLAPRDDGAEVEYSMEVVHYTSFSLDPFTPARIRLYGDSLEFSAKKGDEAFTQTCTRSLKF